MAFHSYGFISLIALISLNEIQGYYISANKLLVLAPFSLCPAYKRYVIRFPAG